MTVKVDLSGLKRATQRVEESITESVVEAVADIADQLKEAMIDKIRDTGKTGRIYKRRSVTHQASAPGEYPANDTGQFVSSIGVRIEDQGLTAFVGSNTGSEVKHALPLEMGTKDMAPRPYAQPTLETYRKPILRRLNDAVKEGNRKAQRP